MKPPVEAPTSRQRLPAGRDAERVERRRELDAAAGHPRVVGRDDLDGDLGGERLARLVDPLAVDPHDPGQYQALGPCPRRGKLPLDEELIESNSFGGHERC